MLIQMEARQLGPDGKITSVSQVELDQNVISHATHAFMPVEQSANANAIDPNFKFRSRDEFARFFDGLDLVQPGIVSIAEWRAEQEPAYGAVAGVPQRDR